MLYDKEKYVIDQELTGYNFRDSNINAYIERCYFQWRILHRVSSARHAKIHSYSSNYSDRISRYDN